MASQMQINQLPVIPQAPADADVLAIEVNGVTYKVSKSALASAILGTIDTTPTQSSTRLVQSGGVYNAIQQSTASVGLNVTGTTWAELYAILSKIPNNTCAAVSILTDGAIILSGNTLTAGVQGVVSRFSNGSAFSFMCVGNDASGLSNAIYTWRVTGWTSSSATPTVGSISKYRRSALETVSVSIPSDAASSIDEIQLRANGYMAMLRVMMKTGVASGATITTLSLGSYAPPILISGSCFATTVNDGAKVFRVRLETTGRFTFQASASPTNTVLCTFVYPLNQ